MNFFTNSVQVRYQSHFVRGITVFFTKLKSNPMNILLCGEVLSIGHRFALVAYLFCANDLCWNPKYINKMAFPCVTLDIHLTSMCIDFVHWSETELTKQSAQKKALTFYCPCPDLGQNDWTLYLKTQKRA